MAKSVVRDQTRSVKRIAGKIALNLGCGPTHHTFDGYDHTLNIDARKDVKPDVRCDIFKVKEKLEKNYPDCKVRLIYSSHFLEHFTVVETRKILRMCHEILGPGGNLWVVVPNLEHAARQILRDAKPDRLSMNIIYGEQAYALDFHKCGYTPQSLKAFLELLGLYKVLEVTTQREGFEISCKAEAV